MRIDVPIDYFRRDDVSHVLAMLAERAGPAACGIVRPPVDWAAAAGVTGALVTVLVALVCASVVLPSTLSGERLFSEGAAAGVAAGFVFGVMLARITRRTPLVAGAVTAVALMTASGSAALVVNLTNGSGRARTVPVDVAARRSFAEHGRRQYVVDVLMEGVPKRLYPDEAAWKRLNESDTFTGCVCEGRFGFPVILQVTHACRMSGARRGLTD